MLQYNDFVMNYVVILLVWSTLTASVIVFLVFSPLSTWHYGHVLRNSLIPTSSTKVKELCGYLVPTLCCLAPVMSDDDVENFGSMFAMLYVGNLLLIVLKVVF